MAIVGPGAIGSTFAWRAGLDIVRAGGNALVPTAWGALRRLPDVVLTLVLWIMSRTQCSAISVRPSLAC